MKKFAALIFASIALAFTIFGPAHAQTSCNSGVPWATQEGTMIIGDQMIYGPNCNQFQDGGNPALGNGTTFFVDNAGNDNNSGSALFPFQHVSHCITIAYQQLLSHSVTCTMTAGQIFTENLYQVFFAKSGFGGELFFASSVPGTQFTLRCAPGQQGIIQVGDIGILIDRDTIWDSNFNSCPHTILGHNYGVMDFFENVNFIVNNGDILNSDFDFHFNVNLGFTYTAAGGTITYLFNLGPGSILVLQGAINHTGTSIIGQRPFWIQGGSKMIIEGNVSWGTTGLTASSPGLVTGNSVLINEINANPPGGVPVTQAGGTNAFGNTGTYCGLATTC
jgi:hypothetical protein